ncbi:MAG TPA: hypothetical protein VK210_00170 [Terriglobia bacterium]|nr:hypothetical protein [Terriglobia bacterium]
MNILRTSLFAILVLAAMVIIGAHYVDAQGLSNGTLAKFDHPIAIPGFVLPAGSYEFRQATDSVVQVWDMQTGKLITSLITNAAQQPEFAERQEFEFVRPDADRPVELKAWFRDGTSLGHEFIYQDHVAHVAGE